MTTLRNRENTRIPETEQQLGNSSNDNNNGKPAAPKEKSDPMIYIIFVSLLFDLLAFTIILPLLPSLLEYYRINDSSGLYAWLTTRVRWFQQLLGAPDRYLSVLFGGFLGSMFSFLQFLASPIVGSLSDYYGRRPVLLICAVSWSAEHKRRNFQSLNPSIAAWHSAILSYLGMLQQFCPICAGTRRGRHQQGQHFALYERHHGCVQRTDTRTRHGAGRCCLLAGLYCGSHDWRHVCHIFG